ncbi:MAG TPA: hypothetical protein QGH10_14700 [Armatimonadota bacterium]|nr:hypothetical protein [Armatimonadota bacterium]
MNTDASASHPPQILALLERLYSEEYRAHQCRPQPAPELADWRHAARPALRRLIGLDAIEASHEEHLPPVRLFDEVEEFDGYARRPGRIETEPNVQIEFWMLRPTGAGPFPLAVLPHGHEERGHDTYAGVAHSPEHRERRIVGARADVAVQAAQRGFVAIAPNTRGFGPSGIADLNARHDNRGCRSELMHCILADRTPIGERVWDLSRVLDWACGLPEVDASRVLMMGNSGGGVATVYASACDTRVSMAVPSCSYCTFVGKSGLIHHCDCNCVPGIMRFGEMHDVAALIAPRPILIVNGREDPLFPTSEVDRAVERLRAIYRAAGAERHFGFAWGPEGHRFYPDVMWPVVEHVLNTGDLTA